MKTSCKNRWLGVLASQQQRRIIARHALRLGAATALALTLAACTATRFAYNQAPTVSYWWIDRYVDLSDTQTAQTREDLNAFFQWHRRQELPSYASLLRQWQAMSGDSVTPAQACSQFDDIRQRLDRAAAEAVEPFARLAVQLSPAQLENLKKQQAESNEKFEKDFLSGTPEQRLERRHGVLAGGRVLMLRSQAVIQGAHLHLPAFCQVGADRPVGIRPADQVGPTMQIKQHSAAATLRLVPLAGSPGQGAGAARDATGSRADRRQQAQHRALPGNRHGRAHQAAKQQAQTAAQQRAQQRLFDGGRGEFSGCIHSRSTPARGSGGDKQRYSPASYWYFYRWRSCTSWYSPAPISFDVNEPEPTGYSPAAPKL